MADSSLPLQAAIVSALRIDGGVDALVGDRIYDRPSSQAVMPYISIGPEDWASNDGVGVLAYDGAIQLDVWSVTVGKTEAKRIAGAVQNALHTAELNLESGDLILLLHRVTRYFTEADGLTTHAAMDFRAVTQS